MTKQSIVDSIIADHAAAKKEYERVKDSITNCSGCGGGGQHHTGQLHPQHSVNKTHTCHKADELIKLICVHSNAEELVMYKELASVEYNGNKLIEHNFEEHAHVEKLLYELENMKMDNDNMSSSITEFRQKLETAMKLLSAHIDKEETVILPWVRNNMTLDKQYELGQAYINAKSTVPTKPHPSAPKEGFVGAAAKKVEKSIDDIKEKMSGGTQTS